MHYELLPQRPNLIFIFLFQNNANSCLDSCEFLTWLKNFQSLSYGDGSLLPVPGPLNVTILNFTSLSLQWSHVLNSNGTPVYLVEIMFDDEVSRLGPFYPNQVILISICDTHCPSH